VLWFQSFKMACNASTAAENTIEHYSHVCSNILEHFEKKIHIYKLFDWTHHQILTIEKTNSWSMYIYILKLINVGCVISLLRNLHSLSRKMVYAQLLETALESNTSAKRTSFMTRTLMVLD
jgi:uncharacterized protein YpbB